MSTTDDPPTGVNLLPATEVDDPRCRVFAFDNRGRDTLLYWDQTESPEAWLASEDAVTLREWA